MIDENPALWTDADREALPQRLALNELRAANVRMVVNSAGNLEIIVLTTVDNRCKEILFERTQEGWIFKEFSRQRD